MERTRARTDKYIECPSCGYRNAVYTKFTEATAEWSEDFGTAHTVEYHPWQITCGRCGFVDGDSD